MPHVGPDEVIARIEEWRGKSVRWQPLGGGITNHNYGVWVDGAPEAGSAKYVMRIPGAGTDRFIDRDVERDCMLQAARVGVGPRVVHQIEPEGALVIAFVEGETLHPEALAGHPKRIEQAVRTVKTFHDGAVLEHEIHVFAMLRDYVRIARDVAPPMPDRLLALLPSLRHIEAALAREPVRGVACHNDLLSENFIVDADGKMWIIDWEYGGTTDPYFDLGDFVMEHPFSREEERLVIATYCGEMSESRFARMMLYKVVTAIWWATWAMIQDVVSEIDFDYAMWGMERVARAESGLGDPDYGVWLEAVRAPGKLTPRYWTSEDRA